MHPLNLVVPLFKTVVLLACVYTASCIKCYQCSTSEDPKGEDHCGAYEYYDKTKNTPVECLSEEAHALGTFCYKRIMQGPRGFIWDGRWRSVERRCAQISERGVNWGCDWGYDDIGVYWEECYCAEDGCNGATSLRITSSLVAGAVLSALTVLRYLTL